LRSTQFRGDPLSLFNHARFEPFTDHSNDPLISDPVFEKPEHPLVIDFVEKPLAASTIQFTFRPLIPHRERVQRIVCSTTQPETVREPEKISFADRHSSATTACCTILPSIQAIPNGHYRPSALGMYTRSDGVARYALVKSTRCNSVIR
jgi:hypothetical protein